MSSTIRWEQDADGVVTLTLDDPSSSANTMNDAYVASMGETVDRLEREKESVRGVVLTSAKKTFFAGGNLGSLIQAAPERSDEVLAQVTLVKSQLRRLETLGLPVAAAINGAALGGGLEIALACHHRVVLDDPKVKLGFPEVTLGLLPGGGGIVRSVRLLGLTTALLELLLQGQQIRPDKALKLGLIHETAADRDELIARARAWVLANETAQQPYDVTGYKVPGGTPPRRRWRARCPPSRRT
ncbi:enoyl-CoA hydratase/isomerase family protein [Blastococcus brunescens]|uniref:Enoyl-CoA hydratase/isomerase family protein n=1 Tax=Blastococcus brunescens TaxID=1564165 RepID=A0ABZ1B3E6_9ACTN|nr:enoyl-CoA hydratase/isomerase family protein [Blastococcus sp. BMG 8361]WRL65264.1 enoyl-CoA hydratase/isomerase family protein [Blastococcus sp. BMG 8361]